MNNHWDGPPFHGIYYDLCVLVVLIVELPTNHKHIEAGTHTITDDKAKRTER